MTQQHASNGTDRNWQRPTLQRLSAAGASAGGTTVASKESTYTATGKTIRIYPPNS